MAAVQVLECAHTVGALRDGSPQAQTQNMGLRSQMGKLNVHEDGTEP